jgi:hypothetical protein
MADALKRLVNPTVLTTSAVTVYTVPASTQAVIRTIRVCNEGALAATFTMSLGMDGAGKRMFYNLSIPAGGTLLSTEQTVMEATEILQAYSDTASSLTLTISGVEVTA